MSVWIAWLVPSAIGVIGYVGGWLARGRFDACRVDTGLRRETRSRHPAGSKLDSTPDAHAAGERAEVVAGGLRLAPTVEEASAGLSTLSGVLRYQPRQHGKTATWLGHLSMTAEALRLGKCGRPVATTLGAVVCLLDRGHEPPCR